MSYDLMVFDPEAPPRDRVGFRAWYDAQVNWDPALNYNDPNNCSGQLAAWMRDMIERHPAMNGPYAKIVDDISDMHAGYSVGRSFIYVTFRWSVAENAYESVLALARKHRVGFYDVSANDGEVWLPEADGSYVCAHGTSIGEPEVTIWTASATKVSP